MGTPSRFDSHSNPKSLPSKATIADLKRKSKLKHYHRKIANNAQLYAAWLSKMPGHGHLAATLTFSNKIYGDSTARRYIQEFNHMLKKSAYPKTALKLEKFNLGKQISIFAVIEEHMDKSLHIHAVIFYPPYNPKKIDLKKEVHKRWSKLTKSIDNQIDILESEQDTYRYVEYIMKEQKKNTDRVIFAYWDSAQLT